MAGAALHPSQDDPGYVHPYITVAGQLPQHQAVHVPMRGDASVCPSSILRDKTSLCGCHRFLPNHWITLKHFTRWRELESQGGRKEGKKVVHYVKISGETLHMRTLQVVLEERSVVQKVHVTKPPLEFGFECTAPHNYMFYYTSACYSHPVWFSCLHLLFYLCLCHWTALNLTGLDSGLQQVLDSETAKGRELFKEKKIDGFVLMILFECFVLSFGDVLSSTFLKVNFEHIPHIQPEEILFQIIMCSVDISRDLIKSQAHKGLVVFFFFLNLK